MNRIACTMLLFLLTCSAMAQDNYSFAVQTTTQNGIIEGNFDTRSGIQKYFGVPFAKPPVGNLRWKAPQPLDNWTGIKETKRFGPRPMQAVVYGDMNSRSNGISEDCLYLNVWTPANRNRKNLPVLVYFYGGGNVAGDASEPRYDGESMAKKGIVVITCNYRLNIFGFFAHPELSAEAPYKASGNYGLLDQVAALKWVQKNIAAFGGDPKKVTIAGESAGSISVSAKWLRLWQKVLLQGPLVKVVRALNLHWHLCPWQRQKKPGRNLRRRTGFPSLSQLRALSTKDVYDIYIESKRFGFPVVIDNYFYAQDNSTDFQCW